MRKSLGAILLLTLVDLTHPLPAAAEACVIPLLKDYASDPEIHLVFRGIVEDVTSVAEGQVATFAVELVWKGRPKRRVIVHNFVAGRMNEVVQTFLRGQRYLVITFDPNQRRRWNIPVLAGTLARTNGCGFYDANGEYAKIILGDRRGYAPR